MNIIVNLKKKKAFITRIIGTILALCALSVGVSYFAGIPAGRFLYPVIGSFSIVLLFRLGIDQFTKLRRFLEIINEPAIPKHNQKVMLHSLIKYIACLFILSAFTHGIIIYPMVIVWLYALLLSRKYIELWKYHGYSVPLLVCMAGITIISSVLLSSFTRAGAWAIAKIFIDVF